MVADYNLAIGEWEGELVEYEVWVMPCVPTHGTPHPGNANPP